jgi:glycosyltransferase involved in cell wall biosynthesis
MVPTWHITRHLAVQPSAVWEALFGKFDTFIYEGSFHHPCTWLGMCMAQARGKRVLLYAHGWRRTDTNALIRVIRLAFLRQADGLLLYGHRARSIGLALGVSPEKMHVVYNSMDYQQMVALRNSISQTQLNALRKKLFDNSHLPVVIYVGRLIASKQVDLLIEACSRVKTGGQPLGLIIVGEGPEMGFLKEKAFRLNLPVHFTGAVYEETQLSLLISAANVLVVPGYLGLSAIHAMTYGTPVIAHDEIDQQMPEVEAIISGRTGAFFYKNDPDSLTKTLLPFMCTSNLRSIYRQNCLAMVDNYYNPVAMRIVFDRAVSGLPSKDSLSPSLRD